MKTGTIFVLVAFIIMGLEVACAQRSPIKGKQRPGFCPEVPKDSPGICLNGCSGDDSCPKGMKCCSNGCGYICKKPVFKKGDSGGHGKAGLEVY
ncbi:unnamed protein product [Rangifer tarandus platyrhynchus]|uniref:WAP domain-containing protein n=1 Tax=Rangifer tarandus platyrhynchus TaxID=3082113 RepID=A0ABN8YMH5_RANTA|nr:unnamed protein product [Rangifer tarandus platyrhynchus]